MRRTTTRRALAAGAGASAILLAVSPAFADTPEEWAEEFTQVSGYGSVSCVVSTIPGGESSVYLAEDQWSPLLRGDNEFVGIALELEDGTAESSPFEGYGEDHIYSASGGQGVERAVVCQGAPAEDEAEEPAEVEDPADESVDEPAEGDATDDDGSQDEAVEDDAADDAADDDAAAEEETTGPPVETDGPSTTAGANLGLIGGAALALAGAGVAGFALRRRDARH